MGRPKAMYENMSERCVLYSPNDFIMRNSGMITAAGGIMMPNRIV
jgi:hypothetical protein